MKEFDESLNTAVFTTKYVMQDKHTITFVSHDLEDGAWQFLSNDQPENNEGMAMLVSLKEIIDQDPSILEVSDLPIGYVATRQSKKDNWERQKE